MRQILVYGDSLSWGIVPGTRHRHPFEVRWPGAVEKRLRARGLSVRVIEDCLNGRRTVWDDPFKPGRNGRDQLGQRIEAHSPLSLVVIMLGTNDFQSVHNHTAWHSAQGVASLVREIRNAPVEPGMPIPPVLIVAPPPVRSLKDDAIPKFYGAASKTRTLSEHFHQVAETLNCAFFDAGSILSASEIDGVHLDAVAHVLLGDAVAEIAYDIIESQIEGEI